MKKYVCSNSFHIVVSCLVLIVLMFGLTSSSPIFVTNQWDDANVSLTVARSWLKGVIPYRDLFEQRGILFYVFYVVAAFFSETDFFGVFLVEVVLAVITLLGLIKIAQLKLSSPFSAYVALFCQSLIYGSTIFGYGGSPEEFVAPFIVWGLFYILKNSHEAPVLSIKKKDLIIIGFLFSMVFWIKFSLIGIFAGFYLILGFYFLWKRPYLLIRLIALSFIGFILPVAIPLVVLFVQGGLVSFFQVYFYDNIFLYGQKVSIVQKFFLFIQSSGTDIFSHYVVSLLLFGSVMYLFCKSARTDSWILQQWLIPLVVLFQFFGIYFSGKGQWYYYLGVIIVTSPLLCYTLSDILSNNPNLSKNKSIYIVCMSLSVLVLGSGNQNMKNAVRVGDQLTPIATIDMGNYIKKHSKTKNPTLIEYNGIDSGFFLHSGAVPTEKYFEQTNFPLATFPNSYYGQLKIIKEKRVQYVILRSNQQRDFRNQLLVTKPSLFTNFQWLDESRAEHNAYVPTELLLKYQLKRTSYTSIYGEQTTVLLFERRSKNLENLDSLKQ